jgi:hypothetical protein
MNVLANAESPQIFISNDKGWFGDLRLSLFIRFRGYRWSTGGIFLSKRFQNSSKAICRDRRGWRFEEDFFYHPAQLGNVTMPPVPYL